MKKLFLILIIITFTQTKIFNQNHINDLSTELQPILIDQDPYGETDEKITAVAITSDGKRAVSGTNYGVINVWKPIFTQCTQTCHIGLPTLALTFSPNNKYLACLVDSSDGKTSFTWLEA